MPLFNADKITILTIATAAMLLLFKCPASFAVSPCDDSLHACNLIWSSDNNTFLSKNVVLNDNHVGTVNCDVQRDVKLSKDNKAVTLHYSRESYQIKNTCYTAIHGLINENNNNNTHGYIEADIVLDNDLEGDLSWQTWSAFWLVGTDGAEWPTAGEIDIAESMLSVTDTILHGYATLPIPEDWYKHDHPEGGITPGLNDNHQHHTYGMEWQLLDDENTLSLKIYYDGNFQYEIKHPTDDRPYAQVKKGLKNGNMVIMFDADQGPEWSWADSIKYSMTISNLKVYNFKS